MSRKFEMSSKWAYHEMKIDGIIRDIRQAHKGDSTSAPDFSVVDEIKRGIEEAACFQGSDEEKRVVLLYRQLGIDFIS